MALVLVVAADFGPYRRGMIITDPATIDAIRAGEFSNQVVMVSDTVILPPDPPETPNYDELIAAYRVLTTQVTSQQTALSAAVSLNTQQSTALSVQAQQINDLTIQVNTLAAKVQNPAGGDPIPPNLADDKPLAEDDGVVLVTNAGAVLVGDVR